ncbi:putative clathrin assembly protein At1g25240 [Telopea speciosissima]|uniref:putative clathrin assembly protein At1g25240 n=1 Tax=Telopea speciosissima TaxID=54955 RepID=UPI001CC6F73A|nr:putative clathrin assembly protein At1g25240 [Telopea speciosissima]
MRLLKRASAVLKDRNSIYLAKLSRKNSSRHVELESAIIKATSHDEFSVDHKNAQRVFTWIRTSSSFKPFIWSLSKRIEKTRSWVVAIKGLMLLHGIFCCNVPAVRRIGRLPFDLSEFTDGHLKTTKSWGFNAFVRAYFAFLDQRSAFLSCIPPRDDQKDDKDKDGSSMMKVLIELQRLQTLLDMLIQIKPCTDGMNVRLILEAMDCIVIEIFDVYSRMCSGIAGVLVGIFKAGKKEAVMALHVLQKAASQGEELSLYFEFCKDFGVLNASELPRVEQIPEEDIRDLEQMISEKVSEKMNNNENHGDRAVMPIDEQEDPDKSLMKKKTIVTQTWEMFDDEFKGKGNADDEFSFFGVDGGDFSDVPNTNCIDPFAPSLNCPPLLCGYNNDTTIVSSNGFLQLEYYFNPIPAASSTVGNQSNWIVSL